MRIEDLENEVYNFITQQIEDPYVIAEIMKAWEVTRKEKTASCKRTWAKKIEGMKKAYMKDKEYISRHNGTRFKIPLTAGRNEATADNSNLLDFGTSRNGVAITTAPTSSPALVPSTTSISEIGPHQEMVSTVVPSTTENMQSLTTAAPQTVSLPTITTAYIHASASQFEPENLVEDIPDEEEIDAYDEVSDDEYLDDEDSSRILFSDETRDQINDMANGFASSEDGNFRDAYDLRNRPWRSRTPRRSRSHHQNATTKRDSRDQDPQPHQSTRQSSQQSSRRSSHQSSQRPQSQRQSPSRDSHSQSYRYNQHQSSGSRQSYYEQQRTTDRRESYHLRSSQNQHQPDQR